MRLPHRAAAGLAGEEGGRRLAVRFGSTRPGCFLLSEMAGAPQPWEWTEHRYSCTGWLSLGNTLLSSYNGRGIVPTGSPLRSGRHQRLKDRLGRKAAGSVIPRHTAASPTKSDLG